MDQLEPQFEGMGAPATDIINRIAGESLGWAVSVVLAMVVAYLFIVIQRMHTDTKKLLTEQRDEDRKTIDRLATVIANNSTSNALLAEAVRGGRGKEKPE